MACVPSTSSSLLLLPQLSFHPVLLHLIISFRFFCGLHLALSLFVCLSHSHSLYFVSPPYTVCFSMQFTSSQDHFFNYIDHYYQLHLMYGWNLPKFLRIYYALDLQTVTQQATLLRGSTKCVTPQHFHVFFILNVFCVCVCVYFILILWYLLVPFTCFSFHLNMIVFCLLLLPCSSSVSFDCCHSATVSELNRSIGSGCGINSRTATHPTTGRRVVAPFDVLSRTTVAIVGCIGHDVLKAT